MLPSSSFSRLHLGASRQLMRLGCPDWDQGHLRGGHKRPIRGRHRWSRGSRWHRDDRSGSPEASRGNLTLLILSRFLVRGSSSAPHCSQCSPLSPSPSCSPFPPQASRPTLGRYLCLYIVNTYCIILCNRVECHLYTHCLCRWLTAHAQTVRIHHAAGTR